MPTPTSLTKFTRQRTKLLAALAGLNADILGLNELENTPGVEPLGDPVKGIVAGLNAMPGVGPYDYINTGVIGTDAIRVGLIYKTTKVRPVGGFKLLTSAIDPRFLDTKNRPALAQTFESIATFARFTAVVNHLKSKGSDCNDVGDPDMGDGQGNCSQTRKLAAQALVDWIATDPTGSGDPDFLILGDLNSYGKEDSIDAILAGSDDTPGTADDYTNLISQYVGPYGYSYVFDGQSGYLDYALSSHSLTSQVTGATEWHINADEPDLLDYDTTFKPPAQEAIYEPNAYRTSDHDPVLVGLNLVANRTLTFLGLSRISIGLRNSDDQGTRFDLRTEVYKNATLVASGLARCITGVTRNPNSALEASVAFDPFSPVTYNSGDVLSFRVLTRIGTNSDDSKCPGHNNAVGLRLYYDSSQNQSRFAAQLTPNLVKDIYLHTTGSTLFLNETAPTGTTALFKDSPSINFLGGNAWAEVGTWGMTIP